MFTLVLILVLILLILDCPRLANVWRRWHFHELKRIWIWSLLTERNLLSKLSLMALEHFMKSRGLPIKVLWMTDKSIDKGSDAVEEVLSIDNLIRLEVDFVERSNNLSLKNFFAERSFNFFFIIINIDNFFAFSNHFVKKFWQIYLFLVENACQF